MEFQVFKNVSFILKFFYLVIFIFKESLFLVIENISRVYFQECGKYFKTYVIMRLKPHCWINFDIRINLSDV